MNCNYSEKWLTGHHSVSLATKEDVKIFLFTLSGYFYSIQLTSLASSTAANTTSLGRWNAKDLDLCCSQSKSAFLLCFIVECIFFCRSRSRFIFSTLKQNQKIPQCTKKTFKYSTFEIWWANKHPQIAKTRSLFWGYYPGKWLKSNGSVIVLKKGDLKEYEQD